MSTKRESSKNYLYFDTTSRNPYRLRHLLKIAKPYEGQFLTNQLCETIIKDLIKFQWFEPQSSIKVVERENPSLNIREKWNHEDPLSDSEARILLNAWKPTHAEAGFSASEKHPHWAARWVTYYRECKVYGLIDYTPPGKGINEDKFAQPFYITELGNKLIDSIPEGELAHVNHGDLEATTAEEQIVFAHIMAKHKSSNPIRRCSFSNSPFPLLLRTLTLMEKDSKLKAYISLNEVLIALVWPNNDPKEMMEFIRTFRDKKIGNGSQDEIEKYVIKNLKTGPLWTKRSSGVSAIDAYWRRLKATGLFIRKGYIIFLDNSQNELIEYIVSNYLPIKTFKDEAEYFSYISKVDNALLSYKQETEFADENKLQTIASYLNWDQIKQELQDSSANKASKIPDLDGLKPSLRYEFICGVALTKKFTDTKTIANCRTDAFGWPIGFAIGQKGTNTGADIECFEDNYNFIVEPSRGVSKSEQFRECFSIEEHLEAFEKEQKKEAKSFFIAPKLSNRVKRFAIFLEWEHNKPIMKNLSTKDFISLLETKKSLEECFDHK